MTTETIEIDVAGMRPAISKAHNDFISALDLDIDGGYVADSLRMIVTMQDPNDSKKMRLIEEISKYLREHEGWKEVYVWEANNG